MDEHTQLPVQSELRETLDWTRETASVSDFVAEGFEVEPFGGLQSDDLVVFERNAEWCCVGFR